jgi:hypothetical protein
LSLDVVGLCNHFASFEKCSFRACATELLNLINFTLLQVKRCNMVLRVIFIEVE